MNRLQKFLLSVSAVILLGALLSFIISARTATTLEAATIGYFYAISLFTAFWLVYRLIAAKLSVFSAAQQWVLKTVLYTIAISFAYLTGLVFQTIMLLPAESLKEAVTQPLWKGLVYLASLPFTQHRSFDLLTEEFRGILITLFAMIFLIGLVSMVGSFVEVRWQKYRHRQAMERAELTALRAQIEPHFLFNSLNTVASLIQQDAARAEKLLIQLSNILRYLFQNSSRETIELRCEIEFTRHYLELLLARFGKKLIVDWRESLKNRRQKVPVLLIQPLIENAVRHAWPDDNKPLHVIVNISETEQEIIIMIGDDGRGITPQKLNRLPLKGHALQNISERLYLLFKKENLLKIRSEYGGGTQVEIKIPVHKL